MKKRIISAIMVSSMILGTVVLPVVALADEVDTKIEQSEKKINELNSQEAVASEQLATVRANIDTIRAEAAKIQAEQEKLNKLAAQLGQEIEELTKRIEKRDGTIKEQARSVQVEGSSSSYLGVILSSESVSDAITRVAAASKLVNASNDLMKQQESDKKEVETKKTETDKTLVKINENAAALEAKKGELVDQELHQQVLVSAISAEKATEEDKKAGFVKEKEEAERQRAEEAKRAEEVRKQAELDAAAQQANNNPTTGGTTTPPATGGGTTTPPVTGGGNGGTTTPPATGGGNGGGTIIPNPPQPPVTNPNGGAIIAEAAKHLGKPYVWAAKGPDSFDCSGFTSYVYRAVTGREIGGYTVPQEGAGTIIAVSQAQAGDLLFWGSRGSTHHVAISTGGGGYIHAPTTGDVVKYGNIQYYAPSFAVRVL